MKENCTPVPLKYRDLERLLERERMRNKQLNDQLNRARAEIVSLTNKGGNGNYNDQDVFAMLIVSGGIEF